MRQFLFKIVTTNENVHINVHLIMLAFANFFREPEGIVHRLVKITLRCSPRKEAKPLSVFWKTPTDNSQQCTCSTLANLPVLREADLWLCCPTLFTKKKGVSFRSVKFETTCQEVSFGRRSTLTSSFPKLSSIFHEAREMEKRLSEAAGKDGLNIATQEVLQL